MNAISTLGESYSVKDIIDGVEASGLVKIPNSVTSNELELLNDEFEAVYNNLEEDGIREIEFDKGRGAILELPVKGGVDFPITSTFFLQDWMQEASELYWEKSVGLNQQVYVMHEIIGTTHLAQDLHFDVQKTLKFFLYLNDVTAENGAFACVPGSNQYTTKRREELGDQISYKNRELTREHPFGEADVVPVEGKAGTLIVFTTEVWHRAGVVSKGERRVMRGHTRPLPSK